MKNSDFFYSIYVLIAKSIAFVQWPTLRKITYDSLAIELVHPHETEVRESWAFPDSEIILSYPLSLTYAMKDSGLTVLILLNTTQLILGTSISSRTTVTKLYRIMLGRDSSFIGFLWRVRRAGLAWTSWRTSLGLIFCIGLGEAVCLCGVLSRCWWSFLSHGLLTYLVCLSSCSTGELAQFVSQPILSVLFGSALLVSRGDTSARVLSHWS